MINELIMGSTGVGSFERLFIMRFIKPLVLNIGTKNLIKGRPVTNPAHHPNQQPPQKGAVAIHMPFNPPPDLPLPQPPARDILDQTNPQGINLTPHKIHPFQILLILEDLGRNVVPLLRLDEG
jgi:hypothetical protein